MAFWKRIGRRLANSVTPRGGCEEVEIVPLDKQLARSCGELCGAAGSSDVIDASVVIVARERREPIVTSEPSDLRRLDPTAQIISL